MIGFRVDGNKQIGMGHFSRCISIASSLKEKTSDFCFICSEDSSCENLISLGYKTKIISGSHYDDWFIDEEIKFIKETNVSTLFVDSYYVSEEALQRLHEVTKIIFLDDLYLFDYDVDAIINYNIEANNNLYKSTKFSYRKHYIGIRYFPLNKHLHYNVNKAINRNVKNVLITTGGTDPLKCIFSILSYINVELYPEISFSVILGLFFDEDYCTYLRDSFSKYNNIVFLEWGQDMSALYTESDIVIAPGSTTIYEALSFGTPAISFQFADNQFDECIALDNMGLVPYVGDFRGTIIKSQIEKTFLNELSFPNRKRQFDSFVDLFDGKGSDRIASLIMDMEYENKM